jgi:hypothetical protein
MLKCKKFNMLGNLGDLLGLDDIFCLFRLYLILVEELFY